jgi:DNA topoisomerase IB
MMQTAIPTGIGSSRRIRRSTPADPGFARRRCGNGFVYVDPQGHRITDEAVLDRVRALVLPPAWRDVWICADERGHLQAVGTDDAGRRQYRYHDRWMEQRERQKFEHIERFAERLPDVRAQVTRDLRRRGYPRERVLACSVRLLERGLFRIGSEDYAEANGSFGLATLLKEHVSVGRESAVFDFVGKAGKRHVREISDPTLLPVLRTLRRRREGEEFLAYREGEIWRDVRSSDINAYVKDAAGDEFSAKDFRTWHATVLAAVDLAGRTPVPGSDSARKRAVSRTIKEVAGHLGNTPAVCRRSYVDPRVLGRYMDEGVTLQIEGGPARASQEELEAAVLALLRGEDAPAAVAA